MFHTPAHKQTNPAAKPGQIVFPVKSAPIGGRFDSRQAALAHLNRRTA